MNAGNRIGAGAGQVRPHAAGLNDIWTKTHLTIRPKRVKLMAWALSEAGSVSELCSHFPPIDPGSRLAGLRAALGGSEMKQPDSMPELIET